MTKKPRLALPVLILGIVVSIAFSARQARAGTSTYLDFSTTTGLTLRGNAAAVTTVDGHVMRLTAALPSQDGSVFASVTVDPSAFSTAFAFKLSNPGGVTDPASGQGGDGFVFVVESPSSSLGAQGGGLGIEGVMPSVAVEFDTWKNPAPGFPDINDPSSNHIGVDVNGDVTSVITAEVSPKMNDGNVWYVWIDYDSGRLEVRLNETNVRPDAANLSYPIDIPAVLGVAQAFVGLTAATASAWQNQDILRWTYDDSFVDGGVGQDSSIGVNLDGGFEDAAIDEMPKLDPTDGGADATDDAVATTDAAADGAGDAQGAGKSNAAGGCSCETSPAASTGLWTLLLAATALVRSRRQRKR
jgi:MYXO-CTERM domain-containing protein